MIGVTISEIVLALFLFDSLPSAERVAAQQQIIQMVARGFSPSSDLIDWSILVQLALLASAGAVLMGWMWASRRRCAEWNPHVQFVTGLAGVLSPLLLIGLLALMSRGWW